MIGPIKGRALIEMLLADNRLTVEEMLRMRATFSDLPGGLAQTRPLTDPTAPSAAERYVHTSTRRPKTGSG